MGIQEFIGKHRLSPDTIHAPSCLEQLLREMELGLAGKGKLPMIPSYLSMDIQPALGEACCVMDAGGTNLRIARAVFTPDGKCKLEDMQKTAMPGTKEELSVEAFYSALADYAKSTGAAERIGLCFSYNVILNRHLDGILDSWCKEVKVPDAPGKPVGASLKRAIGEDCKHIRVLNDSVAALLGAHTCDPQVTLGLILGTGINICYCEQRGKIPKLPADVRSDSMIISTEIGEFDGFPMSTFEEAVIQASDEPDMAHAEKQCAGAYLGEVIRLAWQEAARTGLIAEDFLRPVTLPEISSYLGKTNAAFPDDPGAREIAAVIIRRAAKIAAILTAGVILKRCGDKKHCTMVIEGSQYWKLTGFAEGFDGELGEILAPYGIRVSMVNVENSCLLGAALAAYAKPI